MYNEFCKTARETLVGYSQGAPQRVRDRDMPCRPSSGGEGGREKGERKGAQSCLVGREKWRGRGKKKKSRHVAEERREKWEKVGGSPPFMKGLSGTCAERPQWAHDITRTQSGPRYCLLMGQVPRGGSECWQWVLAIITQCPIFSQIHPTPLPTKLVSSFFFSAHPWQHSSRKKTLPPPAAMNC